ncbi:MAG: HD domain-containing protein [Clostridia bacterium]|nr:HD domain-containing protein [Clostridia bacterium]
MELKTKVVEKMKEEFGTDQRRINHALKVLNFAERIIEGEVGGRDKKDVVILAAVLHDIGIREAERKHNSNSGRYQEIEGPPIARRIMEEMEVEESMIERVCYIVGGHHTSSKNNGLDFQIIWEADLLVNIQEEELDKTVENLQAVIEKNFKTSTGKKLAEKLYLE